MGTLVGNFRELFDRWEDGTELVSVSEDTF